MNDEPSVLDYVKSRLRPGRYPRIELPESGAIPLPVRRLEAQPTDEPAEAEYAGRWPWLLSAALVLALAGQAALWPLPEQAGFWQLPERGWLTGVGLLLAAVALTAIAFVAGELPLRPPRRAALDTDPPQANLLHLMLGLGLALLAFVFYLGGRPPQFGAANLIPLIGGLYLAISALWVSAEEAPDWRARLERLAERRSWTFTLDLTALAGLAAIAIVLFVRTYRLTEVPPEMNSDHAEKLMDILQVLAGRHLIFFSNNGGREALIFYLGAALHRIFGMALGFGLLKVGSVLIGLAALPFIYGLGVELGGRRLGWLAFFLAGVAYWPNVVSRFGLRLPFYFLFAAATMYFIVRGLRLGRRNEFIYAGISLGLGFYGYTPDRLLPLVVLLAFGLYLLHHRDRERLRFGVFGLLTITIISLIVFIPLLGYIIVEPEAFLARTLTRLSDVEAPITVSPAVTLLQNFVRALGMFSWDAGVIWPVSIPNYPALGIVTGGLFYIGAGMLVVRYVLRRRWLDLFLLLSIPFLLLPSVLALAFPDENPNLYRTGGVIVPVFLMAATALDGMWRAVAAGLHGVRGRRAAWAVTLLVLGLAAMQEYSLVFGDFYQQYQEKSWNSSEIGAIAGEFAETIGTPDTIWVMGFPHWVDSRLVAFHAGYPGRDYRMFVEELEKTQVQTGAKLFFLHTHDLEGAAALRSLYPQGWLSTYTSRLPDKDFQIYFVPPENDQ